MKYSLIEKCYDFLKYKGLFPMKYNILDFLLDCNKHKYKINIKKQGDEKDDIIISVCYTLFVKTSPFTFGKIVCNYGRKIKFKKYLLPSNKTKKDIKIKFKKGIITNISLSFKGHIQHDLTYSLLYKEKK